MLSMRQPQTQSQHKYFSVLIKKVSSLFLSLSVFVEKRKTREEETFNVDSNDFFMQKLMLFPKEL